MSKLKTDELPEEVKEYIAITIATNGMMGSKLYNRCMEIIENNPVYFPWETLYNSIPQKVHDAYRLEITPDLYEPIRPNKGILHAIRKGQSFHDIPRITNQEKETIWNKHYSKYNLNFKQ